MHNALKNVPPYKLWQRFAYSPIQNIHKPPSSAEIKRVITVLIQFGRAEKRDPPLYRKFVLNFDNNGRL